MVKTIALLCFFLSGFAGLVYEICWIRQAALVFGSTIEAFSTVLATFFAGLALGSYLFGGIAQRLRRPLRLYAILEVVLAGLALARSRSPKRSTGWPIAPSRPTRVCSQLCALPASRWCCWGRPF